MARPTFYIFCNRFIETALTIACSPTIACSDKKAGRLHVTFLWVTLFYKWFGLDVPLTRLELYIIIFWYQLWKALSCYHPSQRITNFMNRTVEGFTHKYMFSLEARWSKMHPCCVLIHAFPYVNNYFQFRWIFSIWIFLNTICSLSQNSKIAEKQDGSKHNSITQCPIFMKFGTNVS